MSHGALTGGRQQERAGGAALDLRAEYAPDDERAARALLLIAGLSEEEIERIMAELALESPREM